MTIGAGAGVTGSDVAQAASRASRIREKGRKILLIGPPVDDYRDAAIIVPKRKKRPSSRSGRRSPPPAVSVQIEPFDVRRNVPAARDDGLHRFRQPHERRNLSDIAARAGLEARVDALLVLGSGNH